MSGRGVVSFQFEKWKKTIVMCIQYLSHVLTIQDNYLFFHFYNFYADSSCSQSLQVNGKRRGLLLPFPHFLLQCTVQVTAFEPPFLNDFSKKLNIIVNLVQSQDSPTLKLCYLGFKLVTFLLKTLLKEKTVIVELGESQPRALETFLLCTHMNPHFYNWGQSLSQT